MLVYGEDVSEMWRGILQYLDSLGSRCGARLNGRSGGGDGSTEQSGEIGCMHGETTEDLSLGRDFVGELQRL